MCVLSVRRLLCLAIRAESFFEEWTKYAVHLEGRTHSFGTPMGDKTKSMLSDEQRMQLLRLKESVPR